MAARTPPTQTTRIPLEHYFPAWGVDVFESHHADDWRMEVTRHDFLKIVFVLLTFGGFTSLWLAIAADMGASLAVVFNALRLLKSR